MGNSSLKGGVYVSTETSVLFPGETLLGSIALSVREHLTGANLEFHFKGVEKTRWSTGSGKNRRTHHGRSVCCNFVNTAYSWPSLEPGDFTVPFRFILPINLPGSFSFDSGATASIRYVFEVTLKNSDNKKAKHEVDIIIKHPFDPSMFVATPTGEITANLVSCCCFSKGRCTVTGSLDQICFAANQTIRAQVNIDNSASQVDVEHALVKLVRIVKLVSNGHSEHTHTQDIASATGHGLGAGTGLTTMNIALDLAPFADSFLNLYTTHGNIISCDYYVELRAVVDASCLCCGDYPEVLLPVIINTADYYVTPIAPPPPPADWNPQVLGEMEMAYTDHNNYPSAPPVDDDFFED